jgi:hypothetical protein
MKRAIKYLLIILINLIALTILLAIWTDSFELTYHNWVRPLEFLKIIGFTVLSLIGIKILVWICRKKGIISSKKKIRYATVLTLIICSYLYVDYFMKITRNQIVNREIRNNIMDKVKPASMLANGTKAEGLTLNEYRFITRATWFPDLPDQAENITYVYSYDGFLPDYIFTLIYDMPLDFKIEEINLIKGDFSKSQTVEQLSDKLRITYEESEK